jgi:hypothetical protein
MFRKYLLFLSSECVTEGTACAVEVFTKVVRHLATVIVATYTTSCQG